MYPSGSNKKPWSGPVVSSVPGYITFIPWIGFTGTLHCLRFTAMDAKVMALWSSMNFTMYIILWHFVTLNGLNVPWKSSLIGSHWLPSDPSDRRMRPQFFRRSSERLSHSSCATPCGMPMRRIQKKCQRHRRESRGNYGKVRSKFLKVRKTEVKIREDLIIIVNHSSPRLDLRSLMIADVNMIAFNGCSIADMLRSILLLTFVDWSSWMLILLQGYMPEKLALPLIWGSGFGALGPPSLWEKAPPMP